MAYVYICVIDGIWLHICVCACTHIYMHAYMYVYFPKSSYGMKAKKHTILLVTGDPVTCIYYTTFFIHGI